jgi:hypothetical protein
VVIYKVLTTKDEHSVFVNAINTTLEFGHEMLDQGHGIYINDIYVTLITYHYYVTWVKFQFLNPFCHCDEHVLLRDHHTSTVIGVP